MNKRTMIKIGPFVVLMFFIGAISISPFFSIYGLDVDYFMMLILVFLFLCQIFGRRKVYAWWYYITFFLLMLSLIPVIRWGLELKHGMVIFLPLTSLLLLLLSKEDEIVSFLRIATLFLFAVLIGAYIGYIGYYIYNLRPIEYLYLSKEIDFWYTTFGVIGNGKNIRPSGIYDEPGALSFVICSIVLGRYMVGLDYKTSWLLLILGFITFSLAHFLFFLIFLISDLIIKKRAFFLLLIFVFVFFFYTFFIADSHFNNIIENVFIDRFDFDEDYLIKGNNRGLRFVNALNYIDFDVFLYGLDGRLFYDYYTAAGDYYLFGENILSPIISRGFLASLSYYLVVFVLLIISLKDIRYFPLLGMFVLIAQRPYIITSAGYSLLILLPIILYYKKSKSL